MPVEKAGVICKNDDSAKHQQSDFDEERKVWAEKEVIYHRAIKDSAVAKAEVTIKSEMLAEEIKSLKSKIELAKNRLTSVIEFNNAYREKNCFITRILDQLVQTNKDL